MSVDELRSDWEARVTWSDGVFESLERFVDTKPDENIQAFAESGDIDELYGERQMPSPPPSSKHQEYMQAYAQLVA